MGDDPTPAEAPAVESVDDGQAALDILNGVEPKREAPKPETVEKAEPETPADSQEDPKPGTPDKALQKVQQDLSAANRKLEELTAKVDRGESLTAKDQKNLARARRTIDELSEGELDLIGDDDAGKKLVKAISETDDEVASLRRELDEIRETQAWEREQAKYPGVDIRAVWGKALADAQAYERFGPAAYQQRAYDLFTERCSSASASVAAKKEKEQRPMPSRPTPPVTPGGGKLAVSAAEARGGVEAKSEEDAYSSMVMRALGVSE